MDLSVSGNGLILATAGIFLLVLALIYVFRYVFLNKDASDLRDKYADTTWKSPLKGRTKYPDVDVFNFSGPLFNFGLAASVLLTTLAFAWTQKDEEIFIPEDALEIEEDIEVEPPRTAEPPPPPPPPPPPVIEEVPEEEIEEEDEPEFIDQSIDEETVLEESEMVEDAPPPPPPPPPPPAPEVEEIFKVVEEMPMFPGCESESDKAKRKQCADKKMLEFIYKNIKYPAIARENGVEGTTVVRFVVDKDGSILSPEVVRDIGAGCGEEALRVVKMMNSMSQKWNPGKQRGRPVKVMFNLPVKFRLE